MMFDDWRVPRTDMSDRQGDNPLFSFENESCLFFLCEGELNINVCVCGRRIKQ